MTESNYIGRMIQEARIHRSMSFGDLARSCGAVTPKQTSRIAQRLVLFEREGVRDRKLLQRVITALDLDPQVVVDLLDRQRVEELAEWNRWANEPVPMELHVRPFAGFWYRQALPVAIAADELRAIEHARQMTVGREELRVVLAVDRRVALTFAGGQLTARTKARPGRSMTPFVTIGGRRIEFAASEEDQPR
jgi:hypothetical protein